MLRGIRNSLLELFFPTICPSCNTYIGIREQLVCQDCMNKLMLTNHATHADNKTQELFKNKKIVKRAAAYCYYKQDTPIYSIIHNLKYKQQPQLGEFIGEQAAKYFITQNTDYFADIDVIIPVPMHRKKIRARHYNQTELIADGISNITAIKVDTTHLYRKEIAQSQTLLSVEERKKQKQTFAINNPQELVSKHILLVDDIITTGTTMNNCIKCFTNIKDCKISLFAIALSTYNA